MRARKMIPVQSNPHNSGIGYRQGAILTNGAEEFVYQKQYTYPLIALNGAGVFVIQPFRTLPGSEQLRVNVAVTHAPVAGAGVIAGDMAFQNLIPPSLASSGGYEEK